MAELVQGSKGGGCFRRGTQVQLQDGKTISIEDIKEGQEVLSFTETGEIVLSKVTKLHIHEDPQPLLKVKFWNGEIFVTPNHWVLNQYYSFVEVQTLSIDDALVDGMGHLRPIISKELIANEAVYNLTVEPYHTFIAEGICVHNGGHRESYPVVAGSKGSKKSGGGGRAAVEAADTLHSKQFAYVIDLVSEGEIYGLANPSQPLTCVYLDDTPIMNNLGGLNYAGVALDSRNGTQNQTYVENFGTVEAEQSVGVEIVQATPHVISVINPNCNAVKVTMAFPRMTYQNTTTGDTSGTSVSFAIELKTGAGAYQPINAGTATTTLSTVTSTQVTSGATSVFNPVVTVDFTMPDTSEYGTTYYATYSLEYNANGAGWVPYTSGTLNSNVYLGYPNGYNSEGPVPMSSAGTHTITVYTSPSPAQVQIRVIQTSGPANTVTLSPGTATYATNTLTVSGKCTSKYQKSYRVPLTGTGPWDIRISRITADSTTGNLYNSTWWESYTEVIDSKLRYPNSALVAISIDSEQFDSIPKRGYDIKGLLVKVPTNYFPLTKTYTRNVSNGTDMGTPQIWDGNFYVAWTDNPAWCFYDLVLDPRYGTGEYIGEDIVDKYALYEIGKYCDEYVSDGFGGTEPRFTCNIYLQTREEAYKVINTMASIFRGMAYWAAGALIAVQDSPKTATQLFTAANVIDGVFSYQGSSARSRHTTALVSWNDPAERYEQKIEYVEDEIGIERYGINQTEIIAMGCTSRGQAHRLGRWLLYTERLESEVITFRTGINGLTLYPGNIIRVSDHIRSGVRYGGRILTGSTSQITVDAPYTHNSLKTYTLSVTLPTNVVETRTVSNPGNITTSIIAPTVPFSQAPQIKSMWVLSESTTIAEEWRVISIKEVEGVQAEITAVGYRADKYYAVENDLDLQPLDNSSIRLVPDPPAQGTIFDTIYLNGSSICTKIVVSWISVPNVTRYTVKYRKADENWVSIADTKSVSADIPNVVDGAVYTVRIGSINSIGKESPGYLEFVYTVIGKALPPNSVTGFDSTVTLNGIDLIWNDIPDIDRDIFRITDTNTISPTYTYNVGGLSYTIPPQTAGTQTYYIRAVDTTGNLSLTYGSTTFTVYAPTTPVITLEIDGTAIVAKWDDCTYSHIISTYEIRVGSTDWETSTPLTSVNALTASIPASWTGSGNVFIKARDIAGNYSIAGVQTLVINSAAAPVLSATFDDVNVKLTWTVPSASLPISTYELRYGASWAAGISVGKFDTTTFSLLANWVGLRNWWIAAIDSSGNVGDIGTVNATVLVPTTPSVTHTFEGSSVRLSWDSCKTTLPIDYYEVRRGADWNNGALLGKSYTTGFSVPVDWSTSVTFWVKAVDMLGNISTENSLAVSIVPPVTGSIFSTFSGGNCVLSWPNATPGSLPILKYEVRAGESWDVGTVVGVTTDRSLNTIANWTGGKTFWLAAIDTVGVYGNKTTVVSTITTPSAPISLILGTAGTNATLSWGPPASGSLGIAYYEVRKGSVWSLADVLERVTNTSTFSIIDWVGSQTLWVHAVDAAGNIGPTVSDTLTINAPAAVSVSSTIVNVKAQLSWSPPVSTIPIDYYDIRYGGASWADATPLTKQSVTDYRVSIDWTGSRTFWVNAIDVNGNVGTAGSTSVTINTASAPTVTSSVSNDLIILKWNEPSSSLPIINYEIRYGTSWAAGEATAVFSNTNTFSVSGAWSGDRIYWVAAIDINTNTGTPGSVTSTITAPSAPTNFRQQTVDNNVLLYWDVVQGTLPTNTYELRRGTTWGSAEVIGEKSGAFTTVFETSGGVFTYWIAAIDTAGNYGVPASLTATVTAPPDYILKANTDSTFSGTKTRMFQEAAGYLIPIDTAETYQAHFTDNAWSTPQDQVTAGYPIYAQPNLSPGSYVETIDYGTILASNKITITLNSTTITGSVESSCTIEVSTDNSTWTTYVNTWQVYATNFRYVKLTITFTATSDTDLLLVTGLNTRLDSKLKTITRTISCASGDSGGTIMYLTDDATVSGTKLFIDVDAIQVTALGTTPVIAVYDFTDAPDPLSLKVLLFNTAGTRVSGTASITVRGF